MSLAIETHVPAPAGPVRAVAREVDLERPVLVCGVGRSGTSLLQSMLGAHPALALPPETHLFRRYVAPRRVRRALEAGTVAGLRAALDADEDLARAGLALDALLADERDGAIDLVRVYRRLLALVAAAEGKPRVGDKDPRNLDFLPELHRAFPAARVLHIVRDPRSVVLSRTKAAWSASRPWWSHALIAQEQLRRGRRAGAALFGEGYLEVRYERLLAAPEEELRRVAAHVGVEYDPAMLDFGAAAKRLVGEREMGWKKETLGPLLTDNDAKWRTGLTPRQVAFVEAVCTEAFDALGYARSLPRRGHPGHGALRTLVRGAADLRRWRDVR